MAVWKILKTKRRKKIEEHQYEYIWSWWASHEHVVDHDKDNVAEDRLVDTHDWCLEWTMNMPNEIYFIQYSSMSLLLLLWYFLKPHWSNQAWNYSWSQNAFHSFPAKLTKFIKHYAKLEEIHNLVCTRSCGHYFTSGDTKSTHRPTNIFG